MCRLLNCVSCGVQTRAVIIDYDEIIKNSFIHLFYYIWFVWRKIFTFLFPFCICSLLQAFLKLTLLIAFNSPNVSLKQQIIKIQKKRKEINITDHAQHKTIYSNSNLDAVFFYKMKWSYFLCCCVFVILPYFSLFFHCQSYMGIWNKELHSLILFFLY